MANNNIEQYLEAMLAALDGDTVPDVPSPSWNIEKYLAAILTKLSSGGGSGGGGVLVVHDVDGTLDKTFAEIAASPLTVILMFGGASHLTVDFTGDAKGLLVTAYHGGSGVNYAWRAASADSYPTRSA